MFSLRKIYILVAILSNILPFINSHSITDVFGRMLNAGRGFRRPGLRAETLSKAKIVRGRSALRKSLSESQIMNAPHPRSSLQRSKSAAWLLQTRGDVHSLSFLNYVCRNGKLIMAKTLIEEFGSVPTIDTLNMAAFSGNVELVKYLVQAYHLEPERTTLVAATYSKSLDLLKYLVEEQYLIPEKTVLDAALRNGSDENYQFLHSAHINDAFEESSMNQFQNVIGEIAESYMDYRRSEYNRKLLEDAIDSGDIEQVRKLTQDNGFDLDFGILDRAAQLEDDRIFDFLIQSV